jgi:hypothetical protein
LGLVGRIESIETLVPREPVALDGVHLVEPELAALSGLYLDELYAFDRGSDSASPKGPAAWSGCSVEQRCSLVVAGFRSWCAEVAGCNVDDERTAVTAAAGTCATPAEELEDSEERQILCSGCRQVFPESMIHVIPYFNSKANYYATTYRCEQCWKPSLEETRTRLANTQDEAEILSAGAFFRGHGVYIYEFVQSDPSLSVRKILLRMIDLLRSEGLRLSIDSYIPSANASPAELPREGKRAPFRLRRWFSAILGGQRNG